MQKYNTSSPVFGSSEFKHHTAEPFFRRGGVHIMKREDSSPYSKQLPTTHYSEINVSRPHIL